MALQSTKCFSLRRHLRDHCQSTRAMKTVIGRADLDEEGFRTCVSKIMFMLNNRPIQQSGSIQDQAPLTPNSFVLGDLANAVFPPDFPEVTNLDRKLKQQIEVQKSVWKRFFLEFVPLLGPRQKWSQEQENLVVNLQEGWIPSVGCTHTNTKHQNSFCY
jgi:hypothetical protein